MAFSFNQLKTDLAEAQEWLRREYLLISTGSANPSLLDSVMIESYGAYQPIKHLATIAIEDARTLRIVPWDKSQVGAIQKAIQATSLSFSVSADSEGVRAGIPQLTEENRRALAKVAKEKLEQARITVRMHRQTTDKAIDAAKAASEISEDDQKRAREEMQKYVDETNKALEGIYADKEKDIMTI